MFDYIILVALAYFSFTYAKELLTLYKAGTAFGKSDWLKFGLLIVMLAFFVVYVVKIIKNFKNKEQREKEKAELMEKRAAAEAELHKKRMSQYMPEYDDTSIDTPATPVDATPVDATPVDAAPVDAAPVDAAPKADTESKPE